MPPTRKVTVDLPPMTSRKLRLLEPMANQRKPAFRKTFQYKVRNNETKASCANCTWGKTAINCSLPGVQEELDKANLEKEARADAKKAKAANVGNTPSRKSRK
ncbi:hypothetical protein PMZ80_003071 [Knufia obscura]|uniref:Uncharacterized protein n=1 Tax=Knufia obscura TaxID=1635080 RepID=A0ABR0RU42_9EURO|nr:hypothetical protein PMZ80_003071 [Knufia obscura]